MLNNRFILILLLALTFFGNATAQETEKETVRYDYSFEFKNGVYTSFYSFRNNSPIPFSRFVSPAYDDDFFKKLLHENLLHLVIACTNNVDTLLE